MTPTGTVQDQPGLCGSSELTTAASTSFACPVVGPSVFHAQGLAFADGGTAGARSRSGINGASPLYAANSYVHADAVWADQLTFRTPTGGLWSFDGLLDMEVHIHGTQRAYGAVPDHIQKNCARGHARAEFRFFGGMGGLLNPLGDLRDILSYNLRSECEGVESTSTIDETYTYRLPVVDGEASFAYFLETSVITSSVQPYFPGPGLPQAPTYAYAESDIANTIKIVGMTLRDPDGNPITDGYTVSSANGTLAARTPVITRSRPASARS